MSSTHDFGARVGALAAHAGKIVHESVQVCLIVWGKGWAFVVVNPNLAVGIAMGAATGVLVGLIPLVGALISPILTPLFVFVGAVAGHRVDKSERGEPAAEGIAGIAGDSIVIAKEVFRLFSEVFRAVKVHFALRPIPSEASPSTPGLEGPTTGPSPKRRSRGTGRRRPRKALAAPPDDGAPSDGG